jgi:hypothetical protein
VRIVHIVQTLIFVYVVSLYALPYAPPYADDRHGPLPRVVFRGD